jgi:uncharacterized membrane protein YphA (DoxX/SURF4 family)
MTLLRISIGIIYVWFGALKFFPQLSPADQLAKDTINFLTLGLIPDEISIILLALWETILGAVIIFGIWNRFVFSFLLLHLACTFVPLFCFVSLSFTHSPYAFTLVGQYIMKNIIIVCAAIVINIQSMSLDSKAAKGSVMHH